MWFREDLRDPPWHPRLQPRAQFLCPPVVNPDTFFFPLSLPPQDDPVTNLNNAFEVAEKYLDIPKMLDAEGECVRLLCHFSQGSLGEPEGLSKSQGSPGQLCRLGASAGQPRLATCFQEWGRMEGGGSGEIGPLGATCQAPAQGGPSWPPRAAGSRLPAHHVGVPSLPAARQSGIFCFFLFRLCSISQLHTRPG